MYKRYTIEFVVLSHVLLVKVLVEFSCLENFQFLESKRLYSNKRPSESAKI